MSIADKLSRLSIAKNAISGAISTMGGTINSGDGFEDFAADIATIPQSIQPSSSASDNIRFLDYDGSVICSYTAAEAEALSALPALPTRTGSVAQGWTHTLAQVNAAGENEQPLDVGVMYNTSDGSTKLHILLPKDGGSQPVTLYMYMEAYTSVAIDWGDGTTDTLSNNMSVGSYKSITKTNGYAAVSSETPCCIKLSGGSFTLGGQKPDTYSYRGIFGNHTGTGEYTISSTPILTDLEIGSNCTGFDQGALFKCGYALRSITLHQGVTTIPKYTFYECNALRAVILPTGMSEIAEQAFAYCRNLTSVVIPPGVTSIGLQGFYYCSALSSVITPSSVTSIGNSAFYGNYGLRNVFLASGLTSIGEYAFNGCNLLESVVVPSSVTSIGKYAFSGCNSLSSFVIPPNVTTINEYTFQNNYALSSVTIPVGVTGIGLSAFNNNYALTSVAIPQGVTSIGGNAFNKCQSLISVTIPSSVTSIGGSSFGNCYRLRSVDLSAFTDPNAVPALSSSSAFTLSGLNGTVYFYVANAEMQTAFQNATNWSTFSNRIFVKGA